MHMLVEVFHFWDLMSKQVLLDASRQLEEQVTAVPEQKRSIAVLLWTEVVA